MTNARESESTIELVMLGFPHDGRVYVITKDTVIGRREGCDLQIDDVRLSRRHAEIARREGHWVVRDLESTSGIYVNEKGVRERVLADGDELRIGGIRFRVRFSSA